MTKSPNKTELNVGEMPDEIFAAIRDGKPTWWRGGAATNDAPKYVRADRYDRLLKTNDILDREIGVMQQEINRLRAFIAGMNTRPNSTGEKTCEGRNTCGGCYPGVCLVNDSAGLILEDAAIREDVGNVISASKMRNDTCATSSISKRPVINDAALAEAVKKLKSGRGLFDDGKAYMQGALISTGFSKEEMEALINHAVKGEKVAKVTVDELRNYLISNGGPSYFNDVKYLAKKYPNGIKIIDGGA